MESRRCRVSVCSRFIVISSGHLFLWLSRGRPTSIEEHDRSEPAADTGRAVVLDREQPDQHTERNGNDQRLERRRGGVQAFERAQHRDRRREQAVAVEEGRTRHAQHEIQPPPLLGDLRSA